MAEQTGAPDSPQTETELEADDSAAFAAIAERLTGQEAQPETTGEPEAASGDEPTDLSHTDSEPAETPDAEETEEEPPAAPDADDDSEDDEMPPELKSRISKRIGKEVAKRKAEQERAEQLEAELERLKASLEPSKDKRQEPKETDAADPSEQVTNAVLSREPVLQKLAKEIGDIERVNQQAINLRNQMRSNPERVVSQLKAMKGLEAVVTDEDTAREWLDEFIENSGRDWHKLTSRHEAMRERVIAKFEQERESHRKTAVAMHPWVLDAKADKEKHALVQNYRKEYPGLEQIPNGHRLLARLVLGELAEKAITQKTVTPETKPAKPPPLPSKPRPAAPVNGKPKPANLAALEKRAYESGTQEDVEALVEAKMSKLF